MKPTKKSKIYTRAGDKGKTTLFGGKRVSKDNKRVTTFGALDELNASIGLAKSFIREKRLVNILQKTQNDLFNIGAELASTQQISKHTNKVFFLEKTKIDELESIIDQYDSRLVPLKNFILPGTTKASSALHLARSTSRRTEREIVSFSRKEKINKNILSYLNRLSDLLFVLARYLNKKEKGKEIIWKKT